MRTLNLKVSTISGIGWDDRVGVGEGKVENRQRQGEVHRMQLC